MSDEMQKLQNDVHKLDQALQRLGAALSEPESSSRALDDTGLAFEYAMDVFWKVAKEMLASRGFEAHMPREAVRLAHERGWLDDPDLWVAMLKDEYEISGGTYDRTVLRRLYGRIKSYYPEMTRVHAMMVARLSEG